MNAAASDEFYGLLVGDEVCVHGEGFGRIVETHKSDYPSGDYVTVEIKREEKHRSGQTIHWTETYHPHPRNVSLNARVAQERYERRRNGEDVQTPEGKA